MTRIPARRTPRAALAAASLLLAALAAACSDSTGPKAGSASDVALDVGQFALYQGSATTSALHFPAPGSTAAHYLVAAQFATGSADESGAYTLASALTAPAGAAPLLASAGAAGSVASRFHDRLRQLEGRLAADARAARAAGALPAPPVARAPATVTPPVVGAKRTFRVCGDLDCAALVNVPATAQYVGAHAAIFLDDSAPAGGFTATDIAQVGQQFDTDLYPIDHLAFGAESDIDSNGVVIILLTRKVNALVNKTECQTSFVTGFFFGADLSAATRAAYNNGEVFYGMVPDPAGLVSCPYTVSQVRRLITVTFIHEFQHMISFNQHVLVRGGDTEVLWLNEALSHLAEELGGLHYDSLADTTTASHFFIGDFYNAGQYLKDPTALAVITETSPGELAQRGAEWMFVRYLVDRFGPLTPSRLVNTSQLGSANVYQVTGVAFATLLGRWALAAYVSDLPGYTAPSDLTYASWHFRAQFASLHAQDPTDFTSAWPLVPTPVSPSAAAVTGTLRSGSPKYLLVTLPAGSGAYTLTLTASGTGFPSLAGVQFAVARLP